MLYTLAVILLVASFSASWAPTRWARSSTPAGHRRWCCSSSSCSAAADRWSGTGFSRDGRRRRAAQRAWGATQGGPGCL